MPHTRSHQLRDVIDAVAGGTGRADEPCDTAHLSASSSVKRSIAERHSGDTASGALNSLPVKNA
jgi:hypothetical protein